MRSTELFGYFLILSILLSLFECRSQSLSIGASFGPYMRNNAGYSIVSDSILVFADGSRAMHSVYSIFSEYQVSKRLQVRGALNFTAHHLVGFGVYNYQKACTLCPVVKGTTVGATSLNFAVTPQLKITKISPVNIYLLAGVRTNFNFLYDEFDSEGEAGRDPGLWETINHLDEVINPVYFNSVIGLKLDWKRFALFFELDKNLGQTITKPVRVYDKEYYLNTKTNTFTLQLGYRLFPLKK